ncbi:hypothetical protein FTW19_10860 [Terriglobus albidus]|uniref:SWIM-type domain-containing protein n=1 Tax=Terriglobus albidus TaxID=1592106 RepID=A0A5B9EBA7_9BACT|nr:hypothetical protein [Terriglobus albidus]QEE28455.1 hypothetical protein FTW19_10860 [Terriglobus albidus]
MTRGRTYQRNGRVRDLVISEDGKLQATVVGGQRYTTRVWRKADDTLQSDCNCPVILNGCKHAVAVVVAYLDMLAKDVHVPVADAEASQQVEPQRDSHEAPHEEPEDGGDSEEYEELPIPRQGTGKRRKSEIDDEKIRKHIEAKSRDELVELLWSLTQRLPEVQEEFCERIALSEGDVGRLIANARKELRKATSEPGWMDYWGGEGYTPDFGRLIRYLDRMIECGQANAVVNLGLEILDRGTELLEQSNDEGETTMAFAKCLPSVFRALTISTLPSVQKLLFAIDAHLIDEFEVIDVAMLKAVFEGNVSRSDWSAVADKLDGRLKSLPSGNEYTHERVSKWLMQALKRAGRDGEILAFHEREARITGNYMPFISLVIEQKRYDDAKRWAAEGIQKANLELGTMNPLISAMCEIARRQREWDVVATHAAREFFDRPSSESFNELVAAADRAGCREAVARLAMEFLETGNPPFSVGAWKDGTYKAICRPDWPLPLPDYLLPVLQFRGNRPHYNVLVDMAIAARSPDDVLRWYDKWCTTDSYFAAGYANKVATAITESHPERALEIYQALVDANLTRAEIPAYELIAAILKRMRPIMKSLDQGWRWNELVTEIRIRYRNRRKFMEILDRLEAGPILQKSNTRK